MGKKGDKNRLKIKCLWEYFYTRGKFSDNSNRNKVVTSGRTDPFLVGNLLVFDPPTNYFIKPFDLYKPNRCLSVTCAFATTQSFTLCLIQLTSGKK